MLAPKHDESRTGFQFERLSFFTDGVFAICITLLVIEIKVPEVSVFSDYALFDKLSEYTFKFIGLIVSFAIIGHYWSVHHRIFGYVKRYTSALLWINFAFLFSVVLLPFCSGLLAEYTSHPDMMLPYAFYVGNMCFTGLMNCWLWLYVSSPKRDLLTHKIAASRIRLGVYRSLIVPLVFLISLGVTFISGFSLIGRFIPFLIPVVLHFGMKKLEKRADKDEMVKE